MLSCTTGPRGVFTLHTDASGTAPPDAFGLSRVLHQIGVGMLGPVFRAYQPDPGRLVAVKLFRVDVPPESVHRFVASLNRLIAADLTHMGIAAPLEAGLSDASAYLAMDFVAAESFDVVTRDYGPAPVAEALRIAAQLGGALDFAAAVNVYHGALHPRDVLVSPDDTRVTGLGIAQALEDIGVTPPVRRPYTAPERLAGRVWDRRADVFSLAALTYEMLCGRRIAGIGQEAAAAIPALPGAETEQLRAVFARALAEDPSDRFDTALGFAEALVALFTQASSQAPRTRRKGTANSRRGRVAAGPTPLPLGADDDLAPTGRRVEVEGDVPLPEIPGEEIAPAPAPIADAVDTPPLAEVDEPVDEAVADVAADTFDAAAPIAPSRVMELDPPIAMTDLELREAEDVRYERAESAPAPIDFEEPPSASPRTIAPPPPVLEPIEVDGPEPVPVLAVVPAEELSEPTLDLRSVSPPRTAAEPAAAAAPSFASVAQQESRSAIWPIALALVVGLLVGFAFGFGAGSRDRSQEVLSTTADVQPSPAPEPASPPSNTTPPAPVVPPVVREPARPSPAPRERQRTPPARTAPVPARPAAVEGRLLVRTSPAGARVNVDGRDAGVAPVTVRDLAPGTHVVRLAQEGYVPVERRVRISVDQPAQSIEVDLVATRAGRDTELSTAPDRGTGSLMVDSRPSGARVFVDNKLVGTTPMLIDAVGAGEHAVRLELEGFNPWSTSVRVTGGSRGRVSGSLEQR